MELYKRLNMKDMLATSLYQLMLEKPFDKITIKQITDKTGVIRGTFYNHFYDNLKNGRKAGFPKFVSKYKPNGNNKIVVTTLNKVCILAIC